jgi:hypothetical protein
VRISHHAVPKGTRACSHNREARLTSVLVHFHAPWDWNTVEPCMFLTFRSDCSRLRVRDDVKGQALTQPLLNVVANLIRPTVSTHGSTSTNEMICSDCYRAFNS